MLKVFIFALFGSVSYFFGTGIENDPDPNPERERIIQKAVLKILDQYHFAPDDINDQFSEQAYDYFLNSIDSRKRYFTKEDLAQLEPYKLLIDDHINEGSFEFFNLATELLEKRTEGLEAVYQTILDQPFDFEVDEILEFDPENKQWSEDEADYLENWRKQLKYDALVALTSRLTNQEKAQKRLDKAQEPKKEEVTEEDNVTEELTAEEKEEAAEKAREQIKSDEELVAKTFEVLEQEAREKVLENYDKWYKNFMKVRRSDRFESYLNTFAHMFDPHTDYFNPKEKSQFDIDMGGKLEGVGARLRTEGDLTKIVSIVPGGPVWKNKQIEVNDIVLKVTQDGGKPVDIFGMRLDDVVSKIRGKKGTLVTLSVQKKDGSIIDVEIERDVINLEETFAKSAIIDIDDVIDNVGYIDLPKFYSSFDGPDGTSCAADVAKEIEKLKANNVNGIILDLRNNGGGSLKDVIDMSGLFIEEGPIVQVKPRDRRPYVYKDEDSSVKYTGPLIVMINSFSASASEILAAAMQDYDRAIIVGSQSFGKGTVQRFINLDKAVKGNLDIKPLGQLKLTMQKFYRVDGGSTQLKGVTPDINLPDRYRLIDVGEREYDHSLEWSQLQSVEFSQEVFKIPSRELLRKSSETRLQKDKEFALITEHGEWYKKSKDKTEYSLNLDAHRTYLKNKKEESNKFKDALTDTVTGLKSRNMEADLEKINSDEKSQASNEDWMENINKDIYIEESMHIMRDIIEVAGYSSASKKS